MEPVRADYAQWAAWRGPLLVMIEFLQSAMDSESVIFGSAASFQTLLGRMRFVVTSRSLPRGSNGGMDFQRQILLPIGLRFSFDNRLTEVLAVT
jgi:hypothetical protein